MEPSPNTPPRVSVGRVAIWTLTVLGIVVFSLFLFWLRDTVLLFLVGVVVAAALRPLVLWAQRRRVPKSTAVGIIYLVFFGLVIAAGFLLLPNLINEMTTFVDQAPTRYEELRQTLQAADIGILRRMASRLPNYDNLVLTAENLLSGVAVADVAAAVSTLLMSFVTIMAVAFYWTMDQPRLERLIFSLVPSSERAQALNAWRVIELRMGAYLGGTVVVAVVSALLVGIGYTVIGLPYAIILAILSGLGEFIPFAGFLIGLAPAVLIGLTVSPQTALFVILLNVAVQGVQNTLVWPAVMSRAVGVSPLVLLFALFAFGSIFGPIGAFMAIPLAAIIQVILDYALLHHEAPELEALPQTGPLTAVRGQIKTLRETMRERMRQRDDYLDIEAGLDAVDHRIEQITDAVERALVIASQEPDKVDRGVIDEIAHALGQVRALEAQVRDDTSPVGTATEPSDASHVSEEVDRVIEETKDVLRSAVTEIQGVAYEQGAEETIAEADRVEGHLESQIIDEVTGETTESASNSGTRLAS